jgi:hypothetical protein
MAIVGAALLTEGCQELLDVPFRGREIVDEVTREVQFSEALNCTLNLVLYWFTRPSSTGGNLDNVGSIE